MTEYVINITRPSPFNNRQLNDLLLTQWPLYTVIGRTGRLCLSRRR